MHPTLAHAADPGLQPADEDLLNRSLLDSIDQFDPHHFHDLSSALSGPVPIMSPDSSTIQSQFHHHSQQSAPLVNGIDHGPISADTPDTVKSLGFNPAPYRTSTAFTNRPRQQSAATQYIDSSFPTAADVFGTQQQQQRVADYELVKQPPPQGYASQAMPNPNGSALMQSHHLNLSKSQQQIHTQSLPLQSSTAQQTQPLQASQAQQSMLAAAYIAALQNQTQVQTAQQSSNGSQAQFQQAFNALNPSINAQLANLNLGALPTPQTVVATRENGQASAQEEISTIFVVGFPDDMQEREFQNMFTFCPGFEAATLKIPNKELTAYGPAATGSTPNAMAAAAALRTAGFLPTYPGQASPAGVYAGATDPYNLVTVNSGGVVLDSRDLPAGAATTTASWPPNTGLASDESYARQVLAATGATNPNDLAHLANLPLAPRKQIIGFAKFKTRQEALDARDVLQGRRVDVEKGAVLKAEMAKKNLHTKRGVGPLGLPLASLVGAGGVPPETLAGLANITGLSSIVPQGTGETLTQRERELGTLGAMGLTQRGRDREREREEEDRRKREQGAVEERTGRLRQNTGAAYDAFHSIPVGKAAGNALPAINVPTTLGSSTALMSPESNGSQSSYYVNGTGEPSPFISGSGSASLGGTVHNSSAYNSPDPFSQPVGSSPSGWPTSVGSHKAFGEPHAPNGITSHLLAINPSSTQHTPTGPPRPSSSLRSSPPDNASLLSGHSSNHAGDNLSNHSPPDSGMLSIHSNQPSRPMSHRSMSPPESQLQVSQSNHILHPAHSHQSLMAAAQVQAQSHPPLQFQQLQQLQQQAQQQQQGHFQQAQHSFSLQPPYGQQGNYSSASSMSGSNSSIDDLARTVSNLNLGTHHGMTSPPMTSPPPTSNVPRGNAADQNPPINTLYVGNLPTSPPSTHPPNYLEDALRALFSRCSGYRKLCFRQKSNGPMCFVEFDDVSYATRALNDLYGNTLNGFVKGGIRLSFSKNPLGVRGNAHQQQGNGINHLANNHGGNGMMGIHEGFQHAVRQQSMPVDIGHGRMRQEHGMDGPHSNFIATSPPSRFFSPPPASSFNNNLATIKPSSSLYSRASASHAFNHTSNASSFAPFGNGHGLSMNQQFLGDMQYDHRDHLPMVIPPSPNPELTRAG